MKSLPTYLKQVLKHVKDVPPGQIVLHVEVQHDDWCGIYEGRSCDCEPSVLSGARIELKYGGEE